jgi:hypothetical protein
LASDELILKHSNILSFLYSLHLCVISLRLCVKLPREFACKPPVRIWPLPPLDLLGRWAAKLVEAAAELPAEGGIEFAEGVAFVEIELGGDADPA